MEWWENKRLDLRSRGRAVEILQGPTSLGALVQRRSGQRRLGGGDQVGPDVLSLGNKNARDSETIASLHPYLAVLTLYCNSLLMTG